MEMGDACRFHTTENMYLLWFSGDNKNTCFNLFLYHYAFCIDPNVYGNWYFCYQKVWPSIDWPVISTIQGGDETTSKVAKTFPKQK